MPKTFSVGVKGVIIHENKALILLRENDSGQTYWDIPGGRINDDENIEAALNRELTEEIPSIQEIKIGHILNAYRLSHDLKDGNGLMLLFYSVKAKFKEIKLSEEHHSSKWVSIEDLNNTEGVILEPGYKDAITNALTELAK